MTNGNFAKCPTDAVLLSLLDQTIDEPSKRLLDQHLPSCPRCCERLDALTQSDWNGASVDASQATPLSKETHERLVVQLAADSAAPSFMRDTDVVDETTPQAATSSALIFPGMPVRPDAIGAVGDYDVLERIGEGGHGLVYLAEHQQLKRQHAIKVLRGELAAQADARSRLEREARVVASLEHPHIVRLFEFVARPDFPPFLVLEHVRGESIQARVRQRGPVEAREAARWASQIASALEAAHQNGAVHRDVKSSNVLLDPRSGAKLTDFGLTRSSQSPEPLTQEGVIAGTPAYMSPEQVTTQEVDHRTDIYSLGIVLFEMLAGATPFHGTTRMVLLQVVRDEPPAPRRLNDQIPRDLEVICQKAIAKEPERRYQSAAEMQADLEAWLSDRPIKARPAGVWERVVRWSRRNPRVAAYGSLSAVLLLAVAVISAVSAWRVSIAADEVRQANRAAGEQADLASEQRDIALKTLRKLVFDVPEALEQVNADTTDVEKLVLDTALAGLEQVAESGGSSEAVRLQRAAGKFQLGITLMRLNREGSAKNSFEESLSVLAGLKAVVEAPSSSEGDFADYSKLVLESHSLLADLVDTEAETKRHYEAALSQATRWRDRQPDNPEAAHQIALLEAYYGEWLQSASVDGNHDGVDRSERARSMLYQLAEEHPENERIAQSLAIWSDNNGGGVLSPADVQELEEMTAELAELRRTMTKPPSLPEAIQVGQAAIALAIRCSELEEMDQAAKVLNRQASVWKVLELSPTVPARRLLGKMLTLSGEIEINNEFAKEARRWLNDATEVWRNLEAEQPDDGSVIYWRLRSKLLLGETHSLQGRASRAESVFAEVRQTLLARRETGPLSLGEHQLLLEAETNWLWESDWEKLGEEALDAKIESLTREFDGFQERFQGQRRRWHVWADSMMVDIESLIELREAPSCDGISPT